jgi:hypothetical protein
LTEEEKKQKVKELEDRLAIRREQKRLEALEEEKRKETVRRTTGAEMQLIREKLEQEEMAKQLEARRREKEEERLAKERVRKQLEADKLERKRQVCPINDRQKKERESQKVELLCLLLPRLYKNQQCPKIIQKLEFRHIYLLILDKSAKRPTINKDFSSY